MHRFIPILALWLVSAPAHAGLVGGTDAPGRIPVPARDVHASVTDLGGVHVALSKFSWEGEVYLYGQLGAAQVTVPFETIDQVSFERTDDDDKRMAVVLTVDGKEVRVAVDADLACFGRTHFGNYRIETQDIGVLKIER